MRQLIQHISFGMGMLLAAAVEAATISGTIYGPNGPAQLFGGATIRASNNGGTAGPTDGGGPNAGKYTLTVSNSWNGVTVVENASHDPFKRYSEGSPGYRNYTNVTGTVTGQDFQVIGGAPYGTTKVISGTVTNAAGAGVIDTLLVATTLGGAALSLSNGAYNLGYVPPTGITPWSGTVTPQRVATVFTPSNRLYNVINNMSGENYMATTNAGGGGGGVTLGLAKTVDDATATNLQVVTFTLLLTNQSAYAASNTVVSDPVPVGLFCLTNTISSPGALNTNTATIAWPWGVLAGGGARTMTFSTLIPPMSPAGTTLTNIATVFSDQASNSSLPVVIQVVTNGGGGGGTFTPPSYLPLVATNKIVYNQQVVSNSWNLYLMDTDGSNAVQLTGSGYWDTVPQFSPDGSKIAFTRIYSTGMPRTSGLIVINANGTGETNLTLAAGITDYTEYPYWSNDGQWLAFQRQGLAMDIWLMRTNGTQARGVVCTTNNDQYPSFSPDGQWIAFKRETAMDPNPRSKICKVNLGDTNNVISLTPDDSPVDETPVYTRDGQFIAFKRGYSPTSGGWDWIRMPASHDPTNTSDLVSILGATNTFKDSLAYSWEGDKIVYCAATNGGTQASSKIFLMDVNGSNRVQLTFGDAANWDAAFSPLVSGGASALSLTKAADASNVHGGDAVNFTLALTNTSSTATSNTVVRDTLSAWLTNNVSVGGGGNYDSGTRTLTWSLGDFAAHASTTLTFNATVGAGLATGAAITNIAQASSTQTGTNMSNIVTLQGALPLVATNRIVFCRNQSGDDWDIWLMDLDGSNQVAVLDDAYASRMPRFNPAGTKICFVRMFTGGSNDVFVMKADGSGITNLTLGSAVAGKCMAPRFNWDGTKICFDVTVAAGNHDLWTMNVNGSGKTSVLTTTTDDSTPSFSPDGQWLAFQRKEETLDPICKVRIADGFATNLTDGSEVDEMPVFSPDGQWIIYKHKATGPEIYRIPSDHNPINHTQEVRLVETISGGMSDSPAYSWEGDRIAYMSSTGGMNRAEIWIASSDGSGKRQLTSNSQNDFDPSFAPIVAAVQLSLVKSADASIVRGGDTVHFTLSLTNASALTASNAVVTDVLSDWLTNSVSVSGGGSYNGSTRAITWALEDFAGHAGTSLTFNATVGSELAAGMTITNRAQVSCAQTGTNDSNAVTLQGALPSVAIGKIAFSRHTTMTNWSLVMIDAAGGNEVSLTSGKYMDGLPHFSPDGTHITFARITNRMQLASMDVFRIHADGTGETNLTASVSGGCNSPRFSWDGKQIVFDMTVTAGNGDLYRMNSDGSGVTPVLTATNGDNSPCFSPDGQWIVFQRKTAEDPHPKSIIAKVRISDSNVVALTDGSDVDETPMWSPDGRTIIFKRGYSTWDLFAMSADHDPTNNADLVNLTQTSTRSIGAAMYSWEQNCIYLQSTASGTDPDAAEIFRINPDGTGRTQLTSNALADWDPAPSPVGLWITASAGTNGSIAPSGSVRVFYGGATNFLVSASNYYRISDIATNGASVGWTFTNGSTSTSFTWSNVYASGVIGATFAPQVVADAASTPYWWLAAHGLSTDLGGSLSDTDHDGLRAWEEYLTGTDPTNPASILKILSVTSDGISDTVKWLSADGAPGYNLFYSTNLGASGHGWTFYSNNIEPQPPTNTVTLGAPGRPAFYKVSVTN